MNEKVQSGLCNTHCPVYRATLKQRMSPRGFIHIISNGAYDPIIYNCTLCRHCEHDNPVPIEMVSIFRKARAKLVDEGKEIPIFREMIQNLQKTGNIYGMK